MKDFLEPFLYPHNIMLYGMLLACVCYKKKGLWVLFIFYYAVGNTFLANQVRQWYVNGAGTETGQNVAPTVPSAYIVLGCGGSATQLPACATARLQQLITEIRALDAPTTIVITTRYCQPYVSYLTQRVNQLAVDCYHGGDNTYQEVASLAKRLDKTASYRVVTSDFHSWRVRQLLVHHQINGDVLVASTQTFRRVNCGLNCLFTVNLTNFDFYSKLIAELSSYAVYRIAGERVTGHASE